MATTTTFSSLSIPAPDDSMEMSSPSNRNLDDDIDIDFEDYTGGVHLTDDERMAEDGDPSRPGTATDDVMEDDILPGVRVPSEAIMQDDALQEEDEELIDYGEDEFQEQLVDDTIIPAMEEPPQGTMLGTDQVDEEIARIADNAAIEAHASTLSDEVVSEAAQILEPARVEEFLATNVNERHGVASEVGTPTVDELQESEHSEHAPTIAQHRESVHEEITPQHPIFINTAVSGSTSTDTPSTPTDTGLHPMTIRYADISMPLFKSRRQPDGLLKNDNFANLSLAELIQSCRQQLGLKIGEDVSEDQEAVLNFEHLGLMLVEDCRAAFESSLNDVLEVYLQLHQNDTTREIPPLSLTLTLQLKFQSSFSILKQAAAGGQGMSSFGFLHPAGDHAEEFYHGNYDEADNTEEEGGENQYDDAADAEHADTASHADIKGEVRGHNHAAAEPQDEEHEYYQEGYNREDGQDEFHAQDQDEATARLDELQADESHTADALYNIPEALEEPAQESTSEPYAGLVKNAQGKDLQSASNASSTTVQGDSANSIVGEYDDEIINWDDDGLTTEISEASNGDGGHDFSTFLTEYEEGDLKATLTSDGQGLLDGSDVQNRSGLRVDPQAHQSFDDQNLGSEDFLQDFAGQEYGDEEHEGQHGFYEEYQTGEEPDGQYEDYQADIYDEQQEGFHPDYEPGADDEQFHTAQDEFEGENYEHGLEHDVTGEEEENFDDTVGTVIHHDTGEYQDEDDQPDYGDELGFNDDVTGHLDDDAPHAGQSAAKGTGSPFGKRSFDELTELDGLYNDDREVKKARSS